MASLSASTMEREPSVAPRRGVRRGAVIGRAGTINSAVSTRGLAVGPVTWPRGGGGGGHSGLPTREAAQDQTRLGVTAARARVDPPPATQTSSDRIT